MPRKTKLRAKAVATEYWKPKTDYLERVIDALRGRVRDGDIVTISEKAISTALGNILDESKVRPRINAKFLARFWMRIVWGYFLGILCRLKLENIWRIRNYPLREGSAHKQAVLQYAGVFHALNLWSEDGIDGSNLPYAFVSLPLKDPGEIAETIRVSVKEKLGKKVAVMIVDTDKTYSFRNFHFTHRKISFKGIFCFGFLGYIMGRFLCLKRRATPLAVAGLRLDAENALRIADFSNKVRGFGSGRTVWDMADAFKASLTAVSWDMLEKIEHRPIVIVRIASVEETLNT